MYVFLFQKIQKPDENYSDKSDEDSSDSEDENIVQEESDLIEI